MANIPEVQRQRLASSAVGTPGVDRSGAIIGQALGRAASAAADLSQNVGDKVAKDERQQLDLNLKRQEAADIVESNRRLVDFDNGIEQIKMESQNSDEFLLRMDEFFQKSSESIPLDSTRTLFSKKASALLKKKNQEFNQLLQQRKVDEIGGNLEGTVEGLSKSVSDIFANSTLNTFDKLTLFQTKMDIANSTLTEAQPFLGVEEFAQFEQDTKEALTRAAVFSLLERAPHQLEDFLTESEAKDILTDQEIKSIRKDAKDYLDKKTQLAKALRIEDQAVKETEMINRLMNSDNPPSETEIQAAILNEEISEKTAKRIRGFKKSKKAVFSGDNPKTFLQLQEDFIQIGGDPGSSAERATKTFTQKSPATFEQLAVFRQRLLEGMETGEISQSTGRAWLTQITPKFEENIEEVFDVINERKVVDKYLWFDSSELIIKDKNKTAEFQMEMKKEFMIRLDKAENESGRRLRLSEVKKVLDGVKSDFKLKIQPTRAKYAIGDVVEKNGVRYWVKGFTPEGKTRLETDFSLRKSFMETEK